MSKMVIMPMTLEDWHVKFDQIDAYYLQIHLEIGKLLRLARVQEVGKGSFEFYNTKESRHGSSKI